MEKPARNESKNILDEVNIENENTSSSTDCTGLMPTVPSSEDELESYKELYHVGVKDIKKDEAD